MKRKFAIGTRVMGKEGDEGKASFRGRTGTVAGYVAGSGYLVKFDDGLDEYVYAHWLEAGEHFRVFAVGARCGHLISERFNDRADAERFRQRLTESDPGVDTRIEAVTAEGRAI